MIITQTIIQFPEIQLATRDAHKLRGYFGNLFKEHSPLLHNHFSDGNLRYAYPLVQYKVIDKIPALVGFNEGATLLSTLFLKIREMEIDGNKIPVFSKNISQKNVELLVDTELYNYSFKTLWMALNQKNFERYKNLATDERQKLLDKNLQNNILSLYKGVGFRVSERIMAKSKVVEKETKFKDKTMLAFSGEFVTNAVIPDFTGIGKAVSRGFGSVQNTL